MTPIVPADFEYRARGPYIVSIEWPDRELTFACPTIFHALAKFYSREFGSLREADAQTRLIVDSRGVHIHAVRKDDEASFSMTDEVKRALDICAPGHEGTVFELEMKAREMAILRQEGLC